MSLGEVTYAVKWADELIGKAVSIVGDGVDVTVYIDGIKRPDLLLVVKKPEAP